MTTLSACRYPGGKSVFGLNGRWITSMLPWSKKSLYVEPFAGMLGVLLQRPPVDAEIVNDLDDRVFRWWTCLRDHPDELLRLMAFTPTARAALIEAVAVVDDPGLSCCRRSAAFSTILNQSLNVPLAAGYTWRRRFVGAGKQQSTDMDRLLAVADRMSGVQIDNRDAAAMLERVADYGHAVIYCDPPYRIVHRDEVYRCRAAELDVDALTAALRAQKGRVAVSGYGDEWDHLGWRRYEYDTTTAMVPSVDPDRVRGSRVEVLWTNYEPPRQQSLID